ncbi:MAG: hypothetical protein H6Q55_3920 [Deltaproteobacteria bacterium]|jgi:hypothetical protein|nr:hypothetical protein [Deltaproteobacteria bacterium]
MSKATNRRALAVCVAITLLYVSVAFKLPEKLSMRRMAEKQDPPVREMSIHGSNAQAESVEPAEVSTAPSAQDADVRPDRPEQPASSAQALPAGPTEEQKVSKEKGPVPSISATASSIEPRMLISVPVTCHAINEGWIDKEGLIFSRKDGQTILWLKPLDILKQQDEEGIKQILKAIGKNRLTEFFRKQGIEVRKELQPEEMMLGRGYLIEKRKLLALYNQLVPDACSDLFPLVLTHGGVVKGRQGFQLVSAQEASRMRAHKEEADWRMPNLTGLPLKVAIGKLAPHTSKIKVYGSGFVVDQSPRPFERLKGDKECSIHGRLQSE